MNKYIIVGVDVFYLNYWTKKYKKNHDYHTVILSGYTENESKAYVNDWCHPVFYKGELDFNEYLNARSSINPRDGGYGSGIPIKNAWWEVNPEGWKSDYKELVYQTICLSIDQYYTNTENSELNIFRGCSGLKAILEIIKQRRDYEVDYNIKFLTDLHKKAYLIVKRKILFRFYIEQALQKSTNSDLGNALEKYKIIIGKWNILLRIILKCSCAYSLELYARVISIFEEVIMYEEDYFNDLTKLKNSYK